ncbi:MAG: Ig-like domain-containing protein [Treponema sp.]|nr:Ig-like domain-containing protein [Treponema sp.]
MKKLLKAMASLAALALLGSAFMSCSSDDDDDEAEKSTPVTSESKITLISGSTSKAFDTIQAAVDACTGDGSYTIKLAKGTYNENYINYSGAATVKILGDTNTKYGADVIITGHGTKMGQEKGRELVEFMGTSNLILENVSLVSDYSRETVQGDAQAEVLGFDSTGYVAAYNCSFKSHQDTMRTTGKGWFYKCYVEGDTDFIWMESAGIVALYEECEILSVYDEFASSHVSYVLAPRANVANSLGKGAVIYNSSLKCENNSNFLFRNPWNTNSNYYNQGAFVDVEITVAEGKTLEAALAKSAAMGTNDQQYIGWKVDSAIANAYTGKMSSIGTISDDVKSKEYSGRRAILNRNYNIKTSAFSKDVENHWDIDSFISAQGWSVSTDSSKELLEGETESTITVYNLTSESVEGVTGTGFALESGKSHWAGQKDATITFDVNGKCVVAVTGYYAGSGTIVAASQGAGKWNVKNGSTSKYLTTEYLVYSEGKSTVTIKAKETSYLTKITVTYDSAISFVPVTSIAISTTDDLTEVSGTKQLQFSASVTPTNASNTDYTWSISSGSDYATIDDSGLLTAAAVDTEQTVTVKATANDTNAASAEKTITVKPLSAAAFDITWFGAEASAALTAVDGNNAVAKGSDVSYPTSGTDSTGAEITGSWAFNSSKLNSNSIGGITLTASDDDATPGEWYLEYPVTAVQGLRINTIRVFWGNCGTGNLRTYVEYIDNSGTKTVLYDNKTSTGVIPRNSEGTGDTTYDVYKVLAAGETGKIRVSIHGHRLVANDDGSTTESIQTISGKAPTWCKTVISGEAGSFPVAGQTYTYNLCSSENLKAVGSTSDGLFSWSGSDPGSGHGLKAGSASLKVAGNVKISVGLCKYGSGTITVKNGDTEVANLTVAKMTSCYAKGISNPEFTADNSQSFTYTGSAAELSLVWSSNVYLEGLQVEPVSE